MFFARPQQRGLSTVTLSVVLIFIAGLFPSISAQAAVPSARQTSYLSPTAQNPAVANRYFGISVATSATGSRMVVGESGSTGAGGEASIYECTAAGCAYSQGLNSLATRTVSITQISITGKKATATTSAAHGFLPGEKITITGTGNTSFNVTNKEISDVTNNTISFYSNSLDLAATSVSGTGTVDLAPASSAFGQSVDISDDGNLILIGAPDTDFTYYQYTNYGTGAGSNVSRKFGRAYLFEYISGAWALSKVFDRAVPANLDKYGNAVALSGDGSVAVVSSYANSSSASNNAEIQVNTPNPSASPGPSGTPVLYSSWVLQQTITASAIGRDVDISDNGNVIIFAADNAGVSSAGNALVYTKATSTWSLTKTLLKTDRSGAVASINDNFGYSVAVSDDGNTVATAGYNGDYSVYVYRFSGGVWGTPENIAPSAAGSRDIFSLALSANGNVAMIGMAGDRIGCYDAAGSVAFMEFSGGSWAQSGGLRSSDKPTYLEYFGYSVALAEDGSSFAATGGYNRKSGALNGVGGVTTFSAFAGLADSTAPTLTLQQGCSATGVYGTVTVQSDPTNTATIKFELAANESIDPTTISAADFTITNGTYSSASCSSTYCIITVTGTSVGAVTIDLSGSFSVSDTQGNAATTADGTDRSVNLDNAAPTLTSSTPADNATGVALNSNIVLNFSENVTFQSGGSIAIYRIKPATVTPSGINPITFESFSSTSSRVTGSGTSTITIDPTSDLLPGYSYYIAMANTVLMDVAGNYFAGLNTASQLNFSVTADTVAPTLSSSTPADDSSGFGVASNITLNFSEDVFHGGKVVIPATGTSAQTSISVTDNAGISVGQAVSGTGIGTNAVVSSISGTIINLSVANTGAVSGNATFTSVIPRTVSGTSGQNTITVTSNNGISVGQGVAGTGIALNATVTSISGTTITLSSANTATVSGTGTFFQPLVLKKSSDGSTVQVFAYDASQVSISSAAVTINPTSDLAYSTAYYLEIPSTFLKDASNNYYSGITGSTTLNFTTAADTTAPTVSTLSPADNLTTVGISQNLVITFSEVVNQGTGSISIKLLSDNSIFESIPVNDARITGWGTNTITIDPSGTFAGTISYYINIPSGAIVDTANNAYVGITNNSSWNFTVADTTPPSLVSIVTNSAGTLVTLTYNENLASSTSYLPATTQFNLLVGGVSNVITARSVLNTTVTLTPTTAINPGAVVTLSYTDSALTGDIQDLAYNDAPSFTNQAVTNLVVPKVTNVTSSTANGTFVPGNPISIQVDFSGPVTVTGTPTLLLETGSVDRLASYTSGTGTSTLNFSYTVQAGDSSGDLDYNSTTALTLSGGTLTNANGSAVLTLPTPGTAGSLAANKALVITSGPLSLNISPSSITYSDTSINDDFLDTTGIASGIGSGTYVFGITGGTSYPTSSTTPPNTAVVKYTVGKVGTYGTLWIVNTAEATYNLYNGYWRFVPNDDAINALTTTVSETFVVTLDNGTNNVTNNITVTYVGVNDRPTVAISTTPSNDFAPVPMTTTCGFDTPYAVDFGEMPTAETCNYAFDNQDGTKFLNFDQNSSLLIDSGAVYTLTGIGMTTANDFVSRDPITFTIYGSNVSRTSGMTKIASITNVAAPIDRGALYPAMNFTNSSSYRYYKIKWESVRSPLDANSIQIAEIRLIGFSGGTLTYTEGQVAQVLESGFTLNDLDGQIVSANVKISAGLTTGDLLSLNVDSATMGAIVATYNSSTGLLALTGNASATQYQAALRSVKYSSTSTNPTAIYSSRTVTWEITDSTGLKNTSVVTSIAVISVNDVPVISDLTAKSIPENAAAQLLDSSVTLTDADSPNFFEGSISVTGLLAGDVLSISTTTTAAAGAIRKAGLEVQWSDGSTWQKIGTISGGNGSNLLINFTTVSATRAIVESVIESLLISSSSTTTSRTLTITVDDGDGGVSAGGLLVVTITDGTPPSVTLIPALIKNTGAAVATSNEAGKIYLVRADQIVNSEASILALLDFYWNVTSGVTAGNSASIDAAGLSDGSFVAYAVDAAGNISTASSDVIQISGSAPTAGVLSNIVSPSKATSFVFQLAFSESITGLTFSDFSNTGTATGCVFTPSGSSGSSFNVTVTSCSEGTLILRLAANSVVDSSSNTGPPSAVTSTSITIDRTAPTLSWTSPPATATSLPLSYTLTFSEAISGLTADDFVNADTTSAKAIGCIFTPSASAGTVITLAVTGCSDGILTLRLKLNSVSDGAGNLGTVANSNASTVTIDRAPPVITWITPSVSGFTTSTSITPNWTVADGVSLASSGIVNLMRATLTGDVCGSYISQGAQTKNAATTLTTGYCYYWLFATPPSDSAGNATTGASLSSSIVKVDTAGTIVSIVAPFTFTSYAADQPIIFNVTFSRNITGIEGADFVNQGTALGCSFAPQSGSYLTTDTPLKVHVTNCGEGTLILELSANSVFHSTNVAAPSVAFRSSTITIDRTAPTIIGKNPSDGSSNILVDSNIVLTFSEIVNSQIGTITLRKISGEVAEQLSVTDSQVTGFGTDTITINFDRDLVRSTIYYLEIDSGAFVDHVGLPFAGYTGPSSLLFTSALGLSQSITLLTTFNKLTTDTPFLPGGSATSELPISYTSSNPAVASIVDGLIVILSAGTSVITAAQPGNSAYEAAEPVSATLTVTAPVVAPPTGGGGGGGGAPAPAPTPALPQIEEPEETLTRLWGTDENNGLRIRWEGTSKPVKILVISSLDEKFEVESDKLETGELLKTFKPGLAYSISAIPTASKKVASQQTIAYALPPLAPTSIIANQTSINLVAMSWEQPSYAEKFRVTIAPTTGEPLVFTTTDKNLKIDISRGKNYKISIVAIGAKNLESSVSVFNWSYKGILNEGTYAFATGVNNTIIAWTLLQGEKSEKYRVVVRGKVLCETTDTTCTVKGLYGGNSNLSIEAINAQGVVIDRIVGKYIPSAKYRLVGRIYFDGFSSNIAQTYTKKIQKMAAFVLVSGFSEVQISGHSDQFKNSPIVKTSQLSTKRATQVADAMKKLLPKVTFTAVGRGNSAPLKKGKFQDPKNRRVQIYTR